MSNNTVVKPRTKVRLKTQRPPLYKVILLNDDYTPREFVVLVLKAVLFRMNADQAYRVMMTAHRRGALRHRGLRQGRRRDQGQGSNRAGQEQGLSAVLHDRAGGVGRRFAKNGPA